MENEEIGEAGSNVDLDMGEKHKGVMGVEVSEKKRGQRVFKDGGGCYSN